MPMFEHYRAVASQVSQRNPPKLDFNKWLLLNVGSTEAMAIETKAFACLKVPSCMRNFDKNETSFKTGVGIEHDEYFKWPKTSTFIERYRLHVNDLPLRINLTPIHGEIQGAEVSLCYQISEANWQDVEKILKEGNIYAFRKLVESCDATTPEIRRNFLQKAYTMDPMLPYVMFTHLAEKHPDLFKQDKDYWKDKAPDADKSRVVGKLFHAALEEGKNIIQKKEKKPKAER